jgi:hypothetical protein
MNVISMMHEINVVANPMIGESALPDFLIATDDAAEFMRVCAFDQLDGSLDRYIVPRSQQKMNVFGHDNESLQPVTAFATIPVERLQENPYIDFNDKQFAAVERRKGYEVSSRRRHESSRLQERTSAAESRVPI